MKKGRTKFRPAVSLVRSAKLLDFRLFEDNVLLHDWIVLFDFQLIATLFALGRIKIAGVGSGYETDQLAVHFFCHGETLLKANRTH